MKAKAKKIKNRQASKKVFKVGGPSGPVTANFWWPRSNSAFPKQPIINNPTDYNILKYFNFTKMGLSTLVMIGCGNIPQTKGSSKHE